MAKRKQAKNQGRSSKPRQERPERPERPDGLKELATFLVSLGIQPPSLSLVSSTPLSSLPNSPASTTTSTTAKGTAPRPTHARATHEVADHLTLSPLMHIATKELILEIQRRSMASVVMMVHADKHGQDQWSGGVDGSAFLLTGLLNATVHEVQEAIQRRLGD